MDNYNDGSKVIDGNFDDPRITDFETLLSNLSDLKNGKPAQVPIYDFKESRRVGYNTVEVPESRVVILEGIYALSHRVRPLLDLRVSINGGVHFDLVKRVLRDIDRSGQAPEDIIQQVSDTVYPMYKAFIEPDLKAAHLRIHNPFNPFSGFMSPTYILKSARPVTIDAIQSVLGTNAIKKSESETYDIYLVPPGEDPETCQSWLRMRYRDGRYNLMFEEWVVEGHFIISPRVTFEVPVRILGGLMALGYEIGTIMQRTSESYSREDGRLTVKIDHILGMNRQFVQVQGKDRSAVALAGTALGLDGSYVPHSYIELVQLENLTQSFQTVTEDLKRRFAVNGEPLSDEHVVGSFSRGSSPLITGSFPRQMGFSLSSPQQLVPPPVSLTGDASFGRGLQDRFVQRNKEAGLSTSAPIAVRSMSAGRAGLLSQHINAATDADMDAAVLTMNGRTPLRSGAGNGNHQNYNNNNNNTINNNYTVVGGATATSSAGGSTSPEERGVGGSRPSSPSGGVESQLRKLMHSQALLTSQMEELTLQLSLAQTRQRQEDQASDAKRWMVPAGYASAGVALGLLLAMTLMR